MSHFIEKLSLELIPFAAVLTLVACSLAPITQVPLSFYQRSQASFRKFEPANIPLIHLVKDLQAKGEQVTIADTGSGVQTSASFAMKIVLTNGKDNFSVKNSASGTPGKQIADITSFDIYLIDSSDVPSGELKPTLGPIHVAADVLGSQQTVVLSNLTSSTGSYYVAVMAKEGTANITNLNSCATIAGNNVYISTKDGSGSAGISVGPPPSYTVDGTVQLIDGLTLLDAVGASIDTDVTFTEGSTTPVETISAH